MLVFSLIAATHAAEPLPVVTLGAQVAMDKPLPMPASTGVPAPAPVPGGWVPAFADCLEERAPQRFTVVDRASLGATISQLREHMAEIKALSARWIVVTLGPEGETKGVRNDLEALVGDLGVEHVVLVGQVPVPSEDPEPSAQPTPDERAAKWNKLLGDVASRHPIAVHVDLWAGWPKDTAGRAALSTPSGQLSDQGLARVAAAVCDAVLAKP